MENNIKITTEYPAAPFIKEEIEKRILEWIKSDDRSVIIGTGIDDDEKHTLLAVSWVQRDHNDVSEYYSIGSVKQAFPPMPLISDFILPEKPKKIFNPTEFDERKIKQWEKSFNPKFCNIVMGTIIKFDSLLEYSMTYALDNIGEVHISLNKDEEDIRARDYISVSLNYQNTNTRKIIGEFIYTKFPKNIDSSSYYN